MTIQHGPVRFCDLDSGLSALYLLLPDPFRGAHSPPNHLPALSLRMCQLARRVR